MKLPPLLREPRLSIALLLAALLFGSAMLNLAWRLHGQGQAAMAREQGLQIQARRAAEEAPQRLARDRQNQMAFRQVKASGFLEAENQVGWITALGRTRSQLGVESVTWRVWPRAPSSLLLGLSRSDMDITLSRVDAAGLGAFLERLAELAPGRFTVERCGLAFPSGSPAGQADCRLNWWTWEDVHLQN
ncbi:MAG: hypothetical protein AB1899_17960 [Pseudomonadota bacterium]